MWWGREDAVQELQGEAMNHFEKTYKVCRSMWAKGYYPTPTRLNARLHGRINRNINGVECKARNQFLSDRGIPHLRRAKFNR